MMRMGFSPPRHGDTERQFAGPFVATSLCRLSELRGPEFFDAWFPMRELGSVVVLHSSLAPSVGRPLRGRRIQALAPSERSPYPPVLIHGPKAREDLGKPRSTNPRRRAAIRGDYPMKSRVACPPNAARFA